MKHFITIIIFSFLQLTASAQGGQNVKGTVLDKDSDFPMIGANVTLTTEQGDLHATTDVDGVFLIKGVAAGRHVIQISFLGYEVVTIPNVFVTAGKEVVLNIAMEESLVSLDEVVISSKVDKDKTINEMATVSARTFSLEEVTRYSGGRNDASRLVSNFAGVSTADDSRNDIVIRGNSPSGVLWRLEGIPIPNPNHYSTLGTTGGPVSALNTNLLKNSDFLTSAFPAEYGNATSGVFDVGFRNGNKDTYEGTLQLGAFSGIEAMVEGPMYSGGDNSFLISFRNSFAEFAQSAGLDIGTNAVPRYRDLSYKLDFGKVLGGRLSAFGIVANSSINFNADEIDETDLFAEADANSMARSNIFISGLKHNYLINDKAYLQTVLSFSRTGNQFSEERLTEEIPDGSYINFSGDDVLERQSVSTAINIKHSSRLTTRAGIIIERLNLNSEVKDRISDEDLDGDGLRDFRTLRDVNDDLFITQAYFHNKYRLSEKARFHIGLHAQHLSINEKAILEPRTAFNYDVSDKTTFNAAYGLHSQVPALPLFFYLNPDRNGTFKALNTDLDFQKAHHFVVGLDHRLAPDWRLKVEAYYQSLYDIPVDKESATSFSVLNAGADFVFPAVGELSNSGTGTNYGVEVTIEKFFSSGFYGLMTTSLFQSKYKGSDLIERNTAFNNNYVVNLLGGYEYDLSKSYALTIDFKMTTSGGRHYTPVDLEASQLRQSEVLVEELAFSEQYPSYFRTDLKIGFRMNSSKRKFSQQFFIDFQNITNRKNVFVNRYNRATNEVNTVYQSGFLPDLMYRIQF